VEDFDWLRKEVNVLRDTVVYRMCRHSQGVLGHWLGFGLIILSDKVSFVSE
jgi:hypothetical protein